MRAGHINSLGRAFPSLLVAEEIESHVIFGREAAAHIATAHKFSGLPCPYMGLGRRERSSHIAIAHISYLSLLRKSNRIA
jgi:O-phosphoseryl-tRNA(Cys) synthetase